MKTKHFKIFISFMFVLSVIFIMVGCAKELVEPPTRKVYGGKAFDYNSIIGYSTSNVKVSVYSHEDILYLYMDAIIDGKEFVTSKVLNEELWESLSDKIVNAEEVKNNNEATNIAWVKTESDGNYKMIEPLTLDDLNIDSSDIYAGNTYNEELIEADKKIFEGVPLEEALGGSAYVTENSEEIIYAISDLDYALVAEQIKSILACDKFTVNNHYSFGYRNGIKLSINCNDNNYTCIVTGHGQVVSIKKG